MLQTEFRIAHHAVRDCEIVEVRYKGQLVAVIYPGDPGIPTMHVCSAHVAHEFESAINDVVSHIYTFKVHP